MRALFFYFHRPPARPPSSRLTFVSRRRWYDFLTSVCAIIEGTFTVVGMIDAALYKRIKAGKQL